jgi:Ser/Thr protein kinase RdoA (MazF antagonist)
MRRMPVAEGTIMFTDPSSLPEGMVQAVLAHYGLLLDGPPVPAGGTAAPKVTFRARGRPGRYLLRRRRTEFCPEPVVRFDHSVIRRLTAAGLPGVEPLVAREGRSWVIIDQATFEVFPFVEGLTIMDPGSVDQVADAGRQLGRLHRTTESFTPEGGKSWPREFHMAVNRATLAAFLGTTASRGSRRPLAERLLAAADRVVAALPDDEVDRLPQCIIHGDYTWSNIMFRGPSVAGIFDFDWTDRQPRVHELATGLIWFAGVRSQPLDPDSMRSLIQDWVGDPERTRAFLEGYDEHVTLTEDERRLLPAMIAETWFCCRIRAMRKFPDEQKLDVLVGDMQRSLDFLDQAGWPWGSG